MDGITKIYLVTNCYGDSNKVYIGKTKNCRKQQHVLKYGNKVQYTYIDYIPSLNRKDWEPLETFWIEYFKFLGFEIMNSKKKGGGGREFFTEDQKLDHKKYHLGFKYSDESKLKMSTYHKGRKHSDETKQKISKVNKGRKHSEETTELRKKILTGKIRTPEQKEKYKLSKVNTFKKVFQYDLDLNLIKEWENKRRASLWIKEITGKSTNIQSQIRDCCNGKTKTCHGYIWKWNKI